MTRAEQLAQQYTNGNIKAVFEEIYQPGSHISAVAVMEALPTDLQPRFWELNKEAMDRTFTGRV